MIAKTKPFAFLMREAWSFISVIKYEIFTQINFYLEVAMSSSKRQKRRANARRSTIKKT